MSDQTAKRLLPPVYFAIALVAMLAAHSIVPLARLLAFPLTLLGPLPITTGVALNLLADVAFKARRMTFKPFERQPPW